MIVYRLVFEGPLRVAGEGEAVFPRSDTLMAALQSALAALGEDVGVLAARPPFAVSSAFPYARGGDGRLVYLLPRPVGTRGAGRWLSPAVFAAALAGEESGAVHLAQDGLVLSEVPLPPRLFTMHARGFRAFDRAAATPLGPARTERRLGFEGGAGLWFAARFAGDAARARLETALRLLGDEGLGRTAPFRFEVDESFRIQAGQGSWVLLSLYHPTASEVERGVLRGARYALELRGGTHASGARRRAVRMIAEGARLADVSGPPQGSAVRVLAAGEAPGVAHDVYRAGLALCIAAPRVQP